MAERYAVVNKKTGTVENVIQWDGNVDLKMHNVEMVQSDRATKGDRFHPQSKEFERTDDSR